MAYEQKDMSGSLFKNDRKERDTHPDYKGSALINGVDHWLDAWINMDRNGNKYMSLKLKPKEARGNSQTRTRDDEMTRAYSQDELRRAANGEFDDSDIPF